MQELFHPFDSYIPSSNPLKESISIIKLNEN